MSSSNSVHAPHVPASVGTNPFSTPIRLSRAPSEDERSGIARPASYFPTSGLSGLQQLRKRKFKSARLVVGEYDEKPWAASKHPKLKWERTIFYGSIGIGVAIGAIICYMAYASVTNHAVMSPTRVHSTMLKQHSTVWFLTMSSDQLIGIYGTLKSRGVDLDLEALSGPPTTRRMHTRTPKGDLHIVPTLTTESTKITKDQLFDNFVLNLTTDGTCTATGIDDCSIRSNKTAGTIINPVRSARLSTKGKRSITYGKVEVVAKMPQGNWLWPAIWMMPEKDTYGKWPASGEIDIAESRGNFGDDYPSGGRDALIGALHWGPVSEADAFYKTSGQHRLRRTDYSKSFHTFGVEWSEDYLFTYIDSRLLQVFFIKFKKYKSMWDRGGFGQTIVNHSALFDPWSQTGRANTPFDQPFYLILNVAVGGTNGFFPDGKGNKPWGDKSPTAPKEFWDGQSTWYPTWGEGNCGNSFTNGGVIADATDCNMACNGNATEQCGGPNRLTVYNTTIPPRPVGPFVNPGTSSFRSLGCYSDSVQARTLTDGVQTSGGPGSLTVALCLSACDAQGYFYAGLEYAQECWCGNAISNDGAPEPSGDCNMVCNGNSTEYCGAGYRLNLYTKRDAPNGWSSLGCYTDSVGARTLANQQFPAGGLTTESCLAACKTAGFAYAGTEYGGECYCGNSFVNGGGPAPDGNTGCNMPCNGNAQETCGGPNRLNVYQFGDGPISSSSISVTATATGTTATSSTVPTSTSLPPGWSYQGCWVDGADGRVMNNQRPDSSQSTVESCISTCSGLGYSVAGIEYGVQCFCDNFLRMGATKASESDCSMACPGNSAEKCGAGNRLSVYSNSTLTVIPVPAVQKTNLTGSWQYAGCVTDAPANRALPYQIIMNNNNTANNCISQCSAFGYNAGGMEYGVECYCGDVGNFEVSGQQFVAESECQTACSGNATTICGGGSRLSLYTWNGTTLTSWNYASGNAAGAYEFLIGGVIVPLVTQAARNGKVTFLEKWGTGPPNTTGAYELDVTQLNNFTAAWRPMHVKTDVFCSSSLTLPDRVGRQINVGGWALDSTFGIRLYWPDGSPGVWGKNDWQENVKVVSLQAGRWYPTAMIMTNGSILVVGGEEGSNGAPVPSLEILPTVGPVLFCDWLNRTDPNNLYPFLAVLPTGGIFVAYYNEARILNEVTLQTQRVLPNMPGAVNNFLAGRTYPMEGTAVLLPQVAPYTDPLKVMICGGSTPFQGFALDNCVTIAPEEPNAKWTLERMPSTRVLTCMTALPDGTYLILNGAHQGFGGFGLATQPNMNAVLYDPSLPLNHRFTVMANTTVARLYHSEAILMDDGRVVVSGSDPEDDRFPQEYRVEVFVPPYLMGNPTRPVVNMLEAQKDWSYGQSYTFTSSQPISKVSLLGAGSSTHGNSIGQRTIFPAFSCSGVTCSITAPPNGHICPPGWFQLFALNANGVPAMAQWVRIGGDPGELGNWPNSPDFSLPGV
ncbi:hypothetical protein BCR34DRAFT_595240 [Clohesyomyces aquaticus]|uniref:Uncharacterized protein n=1 Tax=Clohesyomyces aquaticus TaxID=1231657 RepID=A0A1Y2ABA6_9PLEO|nr:hypothetical protein BCR34DRAFT_595240 [Clohesyomyces aquaticus]